MSRAGALIYGRRAVGEALDAGVRLIRVLAVEPVRSDATGELLARVRAAGVPVHLTDRRELDRLVSGAVHQGVVAECPPVEIIELDELLRRAESAAFPTLLVLDGVEDPRNFGALIRSAEFLGAVGLVFRRRRAAALTPAAVKTSAGAAFRLPLAAVVNVARTLTELKARSWWVYGLDPAAPQSIWEGDLSGRVALVLGAEGAGLSDLVKRRCDRLLSIPAAGRIGSLNVSVAGAVVLAELLRRRSVRPPVTLEP